MTQTVTMPDGTVHNFPDEATPDMMSGALSLQSSYSTDSLRHDFQSVANNVEKPINNAVSSVVGAATKLPLEAIKPVNKIIDNTVGESVRNSPVYTAAKEGLTEIGEQYSDLANYNPKATVGPFNDLQHDVPALGQTAQLAATLTGAKAPLEVAGNAVGNMADKAAANLDNIQIPSKYFTSDTQQALSQTHAIAKAHDADLYNWRDEMAAGKSMPVGDFKDTLGSVIDDAKSRVANPGAENSAVKKLQDIHNNISDDGQMPLDQLTQLDRYFNSLPRSAYTDSPINGIARGMTKDVIDRAAEAYPEFGDAHYAANEFHGNMKNEFENGVIAPIWNPDDTANLSMYANGKTRAVNPETADRAENFMANIKNGGVTAYNQVKSLLPDAASQDAFQDEFKNYITKTDGAGRWGAVKNLLSDPFNKTGSKVFSLVNPQYSGDTKALLGATKGNLPYNYGDEVAPFNSYLDDSAHNLQEMKNSHLDNEASEAEARANQPEPPAPKQLTYQPSIMSVPTAGPSGTIPMNPAIRQTLGQSPSTVAEQFPSRTIEENNAWEQNAQTKAQAQKSAAQDALDKIDAEKQTQLQKITPPPLNQMGAEAQAKLQALADAKGEPYNQTEMARQMRQALGFKRGGAVQPTEAQKHAGNYKKEKLSFQGLPISIENAAGSVRSGKDKDGKEWAVKMPVSYGYFKRTEGADGDHVDCFVGPNKHSLRVYIIDQKKDDGNFDEHKCCVGFPDRESALKAYKESFSDKKNRVMKVTKMLMPEFKGWLKSGKTKKPMGKAA